MANEMTPHEKRYRRSISGELRRLALAVRTGRLRKVSVTRSQDFEFNEDTAMPTGQQTVTIKYEVNKGLAADNGRNYAKKKYRSAEL